MFPSGPVIHITEGIDPALGGTTQYVITLCEGLQKKGLNVQIWAPSRKDAPTTPTTVPVHLLKTSIPSSLSRCPSLYRDLSNLHPSPALIHQHGLWLDPYHVAAKFAKLHYTPHVISIHGMLDPWALKHRRIKKKIAWHTFQRRDVMNATCLHVATEREAGYVKLLGIKTPVEVIPNGLPYDDESSHLGAENVIEAFPSLRGKRLILFLGRVHPVKGLDFFARVWARIASRFPDWHWVIAGPDEDNFQKKLSRLFNNLHISESISFCGPVTGTVKEELLRIADVLVLPSYSESFGMVVVEALKSGTPVLTSRNCPWPALEKEKCGWWMDHDAEKWESLLREIMSMSTTQLKAMGEKGSRMVKERYTVDTLTSRIISVYSRIIEEHHAGMAVQRTTEPSIELS